MVLARDGKGNGNGDSPASSASKKQVTSVFKNIGLISLVDATNINGLYNSVGASVAPEGVLDSSITAADFNQFINIIDATELAKFGLQNGKPLDSDITGKFGESLSSRPLPSAKSALTEVRSHPRRIHCHPARPRPRFP